MPSPGLFYIEVYIVCTGSLSYCFAAGTVCRFLVEECSPVIQVRAVGALVGYKPYDALLPFLIHAEQRTESLFLRNAGRREAGAYPQHDIVHDLAAYRAIYLPADYGAGVVPCNRLRPFPVSVMA